MPMIKCSRCGRVSKIEETSNCLRCGEMIFVKSKQVREKDRTITSAAILTLLILVAVGSGAAYFILQHLQKTAVESEKKQFAGFDTINFKADPQSVETAVKSLPEQFQIHPPSSDLIKQHVDEFESSRQKTEKSASVGLSSRWNNKGTQFSGYKTTSQSVAALEPLQFDYVKTGDNKLVCFVLYRAQLELYETGVGMLSPAYDPVSKKRVSAVNGGKKAGEREVKETARYDYENGTWSFKSAGLSEIERINEIDRIRIEAKTRP